MPREIVRNRSSSVGTPSHVEMIRNWPDVKSRGRGYSRYAASPSPLPAAPWHAVHSFSNAFLPRAITSGELATVLVGVIASGISPGVDSVAAPAPHAAARAAAAIRGIDPKIPHRMKP